MVANASKVKIFPINRFKFLTGKEHLEPIKEYTHPESRKPYTELTSDRLRWFHPKSRGSSSFVKPTDPKNMKLKFLLRK
nr:hypothetical protein [Coxiella-like endosymbiont of Rhipicephalus sanguineus]